MTGRSGRNWRVQSTGLGSCAFEAVLKIIGAVFTARPSYSDPFLPAFSSFRTGVPGRDESPEQTITGNRAKISKEYRREDCRVAVEGR